MKAVGRKQKGEKGRLDDRETVGKGNGETGT
jgi:hypothetical protein